jgi:hypothetical protein
VNYASGKITYYDQVAQAFGLASCDIDTLLS